MKRTATILLLVTMTMLLSAHEVTPMEALRKAVAAIKSGDSGVKYATNLSSYKLVYTEKMADKGTALFYVYEHDNGGFVIAGADHRANAVLGYVEEGSYEAALTIPAFCGWLEDCQRAMEWLAKQEDSEDTNQALVDIPEQVFTSEDGTVRAVMPGKRYTPRYTAQQVEPLLGGIKWNQGTPYNNMCPVLSGTTRSVTGCVATATATNVSISVTGAANLTDGVLVGTYERILAPGGSYVLQQQGGSVAFYYVLPGSQPAVPAFRCYLSDGVSSANAVVMSFDDDATGITSYDADSKSETYYDLSGRRVNGTHHGITIIRDSHGNVRKLKSSL